MLASSLPPTTASPATDDPLDGSRLIAETRALAAAYRRIIEEGSGEVLAVSGPTATFAFVEELVADTYLARWDAFPRAAGSRASFSPAAIEQVATVLLSAGLNETVAGDYAMMLASVPRVSRSRWRWLEATAALLESLSGFALHFFRLLPTASPTSRFARVARAAYLRAEAEAVDRRASGQGLHLCRHPGQESLDDRVWDAVGLVPEQGLVHIVVKEGP